MIASFFSARKVDFHIFSSNKMSCDLTPYHQELIKNRYVELYNSRDTTYDIRFKVGPTYVYAHRSILKTFSPFDYSSGYPKDVKVSFASAQHVESMIAFMYLGTKIPVSSIGDARILALLASKFMSYLPQSARIWEVTATGDALLDMVAPPLVSGIKVTIAEVMLTNADITTLCEKLAKNASVDQFISLREDMFDIKKDQDWLLELDFAYIRQLKTLDDKAKLLAAIQKIMVDVDKIKPKYVEYYMVYKHEIVPKLVKIDQLLLDGAHCMCCGNLV